MQTRCLHAGVLRDPNSGAALPPIVQSTTYALDSVQQGSAHAGGYRYSRTGNPTITAIESRLAAIEDAEFCTVYTTGMAAISTLLIATVRAGDRVIVSDVVYGGTTRLLNDVLARLGVDADWVDTSDPAAVRDAVGSRGDTRPPPAWVIVETPANPTLKISDLRIIAGLCRDEGVRLAVDNTFLTPLLQRPLCLGATASIASTTKYIDGHNATTGGAITTNDAQLDARLRHVRNTLGTIQAPFEAWLTLQGIKTLPIRLERQCQSAARIAEWLAIQPGVASVHYPTLASSPGSTIARQQQVSGGGVIAFELSGSAAVSPAAAGERCLDALRLWMRAENLGAVESIATHPASMTHASVPERVRAAGGITDGLIRLSVGLEPAEELIADLHQAIGAALRPASPVRAAASGVDEPEPVAAGAGTCR